MTKIMFINADLTKELCKQYQIDLILLVKPKPLREFNKREALLITKVLYLLLKVRNYH
jgi:hypothetical protein